MDIRLRNASSDDAAAIARLHTDSWRRTYRGILRDEFLDGEIAGERNGVWADRLVNDVDPRRGVILAEADGALVGFICVYGHHDAQLGSLVDNLHVAAERQRGGLGRTLMRAGARWLSEAGYEAWRVPRRPRAERTRDPVLRSARWVARRTTGAELS